MLSLRNKKEKIMEFKGTPAPWYFEYDNSDHSPYEWYNITTESDGNILNRRYSDRRLTDEQLKANALLISKAPELLNDIIKDLNLLEMVAKEIEDSDKWLHSDVLQRIEEKKQLIKQATEL